MSKYFLAIVVLIVISISIVLYIRLSKKSCVSEKSPDDLSVLSADDFNLLK